MAKSSFVPQYQVIYDNLKAKIQSGELAPGSQLPFERELCEAFGVQRITVRKALDMLVQDGLMETLTSKQQAAVEQAAVMACGYCRTLTDQQRESQLAELEELGVSVQEINLEKYFALLGDIYQYESAGMNYRPDDELSRYVRSDGAQETF